MAQAPYENEDHLAPAEPEEGEEYKASVLEHLDELRARIMRSLFVLTGGIVIGWFLVPPVYSHLNTIIRDPTLLPHGHEIEEVFRNFADPFYLKLKLALVIGLIVAAPVIIYQLWGFVRPALKRSERKPLKVIAPISAALFLVGAGAGYLVLRPALYWFLGFLPQFEGTRLLQEPGMYVMFILKIMLAFGLGFQLPLVIWFLGSIGVLTSETLWRQWRISVLMIVFAAAFLTPADVFSMLALAAPLTLLYFASISALKVTERRKRKRKQEEDELAGY